ncbi:MAG: DUF1569 domain-containing protein [Pyrinomonadaceae bacterium]
MKTIRNEIDRANLAERINRLSGDEKALWGKMTVNQMVSHLVQAVELPFAASVPDRSSFMSRTFIKPLILYVLPMPKEVKSSPEINQQENGRKPGDFDADKKLLIEAIEKLGQIPIDHDCLSHPFFGKMSAREWAVLSQRHIDHHLRQFGF